MIVIIIIIADHGHVSGRDRGRGRSRKLPRAAYFSQPGRSRQLSIRYQRPRTRLEAALRRGRGGVGRDNMTGCGRRRHDMWATRAAQRLLFFVWSHIDCDPTSDLVLLHTCRQQKRWRDRGREPNIRFAHASKSVSPTSLSLPLTRARWRPPHTNSSTMIVMKSNLAPDAQRLGGCQRTHMHASKDPVMARMHATFPKQTDRISAAVRWHWRAIHFPHSQILLHGAGMLLRHVAGAGT